MTVHVCVFGTVMHLNASYLVSRWNFQNLKIQDCIWWTSWKLRHLVSEKLTVFPYGQYIVGIDSSLAYWGYSQVRGRWWGLREICKIVIVSLHLYRTSNIREQQP